MTLQKRPKPSGTATRSGWWWQIGEPWACGVLVLAAAACVLSIRLGWIGGQARVAVPAALLLAGGTVLLPRLPQMLPQVHHRLGLLGVGLLLACTALLLPGAPTQASVPPLPPDSQIVAAPAAQESGSPTFVSPPRISRTLFAQLLQHGVGGGTSPAAPHADDLYNIIVSYGLDPAIALAFFAQESQFCTTGICAQHTMYNWGMTRAAVSENRVAGTVSVGGGPFVVYTSWQDGVRDWCELIRYRYVDKGLDTVARAVPVYAPAFDGNLPEQYVERVHRRVAAWQGIDPETWNNNPSNYRRYTDLESALMIETFRATDQDYQPTWAFHQFVMNEAKAGRPLGSPLGKSERIEINGQLYMVQPFALDTIYTPLAPTESQTNWSDVRRMNVLLAQPGQ